MSGRPVPSQLDQVLPRFYVQKAGPYHPFGRIRIAPFGKGGSSDSRGVGVYTDQDEVLFDAARPVILNGIEDIVTRPDLADRAVFLTLDAIPEESRRPEQELWATFEAERPRILGALLDAVVEGLATLPQTKLEKLPRMADHQSPDAVPNPTKPPSRDYKRTCEHCPPAEAESAHDRIACDPPLAGGVGRQSVQVAALA